MKFFLGVSLFLAVAEAGLPGAAIEVRPGTANVSVGERFQVVVEARGPNGTAWEFPKQINDGSVELIQSNPSTALANSVTYDAQVFAIGAEGRIPEIEVMYKAADGSSGTVKSAPVPLNIVSTLDPNEKNPTPADFAPPLPVFVSRAFWVASSIAGLLLIAILVGIIRRLRFPKKPVDIAATPAISPEEEALTGLDRLAAAARVTLDPKAFYIQLVQILKQFLERRLEAPVLEMTSTETLSFVKSHAWTAPHAVALRDLVTSADLVKFGGSSDASNADRQIQLVREIVGRVDRLRRADLEMQAREQDRRKTA
ncbi:MAG: hypothetical protein K1Y01_04750 [Vicinamibacteria bacterium]|nr:hypothetical protein [Vicinamibacteria bacterium]